jgi:tetratricopeptide (TPR) repeat protein
MKQKQILEAIEQQTKAFAVFNEIDKFQNSDVITGILVNLAEMHESGDQFDQALNCLMQAKQILEDNYGTVDRRTCKVKRNISLLYLKSNKYDLALQELKEVEELEL